VFTKRTLLKDDKETPRLGLCFQRGKRWGRAGGVIKQHDFSGAGKSRRKVGARWHPPQYVPSRNGQRWWGNQNLLNLKFHVIRKRGASKGGRARLGRDPREQSEPDDGSSGREVSAEKAPEMGGGGSMGGGKAWKGSKGPLTSAGAL